MNGIIAAVQGRLPKDAPSLRYTANGVAFINFSLAVHDDKRGGGSDTEWLRVVAWGELAEQLDGSLLKGSEIYAEGRLRLKSWTTAEGIDRPSLEISAWKVEILGAIGRRAPRRPQQAGVRRPNAMPEAPAVAGAPTPQGGCDDANEQSRGRLDRSRRPPGAAGGGWLCR